MKTLGFFFAIFYLFFCGTDSTFAQEQNKRYVLLEEFTNTYCPPCIFRHPAFNENILGEYQDTEVYHISYHVGHPIPDDIFYQANKEEIEEREVYYQAFGTPMLHILGKLSPPGPSPDYEILPIARLQEHLGSISPLKLTVQETLTKNNQRTVHIEVQTVHQMIPSNHFRLRAVVVEKFSEYTPPHEGMETVHHNVFRQTLNGWEGSSFSPADVGESVHYQFDYTLSDDWQANQIYIIAFIQDDNNQNILNAGSSWKNEPVDIEASTNGYIPQLYPNPSRDFIHFNSTSTVKSAQIFDIQGQLLQKTFTNSPTFLDIRHLPKGIYYVSLQLENDSVVRKIVKW